MKSKGPRITPEQFASAEEVTCEECKNNFFEQVFMIKRLSALVSPSGQETMIPVSLFKCSKCNHVNKSFV